MLLFAGVSVLQMIPNFVLVLSTCMRSIISKKTNFEKMTYRMVLAVCGSHQNVHDCIIRSLCASALQALLLRGRAYMYVYVD